MRKGEGTFMSESAVSHAHRTRELVRLGASLAATVAIALSLAAGAGGATSEGEPRACPLCVSFVTTFDPDGSGAATAKTREHRDLVANVTYALDIDGDLPPVALGALTLLPGYEVSTNVQALDASKPKITVRKLLGAPSSMPLRIEIVQSDGATWTSFGYDTLASSAPQSFVASIDRSQPDRTYLDATITGAARELTLVNEDFAGEPAGTRTDRHVRRARFYGDNSGKRRVPGRVTLDFTDAAAKRLIVTRDVPTFLDFEVTGPDNDPRVRGTVTEMPASIDLTLAEPDLNGDGHPDNAFDYLGSEVVGRLALKAETGGRTIDATINKLPREAHLTYANRPEGPLPGDLPGRTEITYHSDGRADRLNLTTSEATDEGPRTFAADVRNLPQHINELSAVTRTCGPLCLPHNQSDAVTVVYDSDARANQLNLEIREPNESGSRTLTAEALNLPAKIEELSATTRPDGTKLVYDSDGRVDELTVEDTARTGNALKRTEVHVLGLPADVTIEHTAAEGENHVHYLADSGVDHADAEIVDDPDTTVSDARDRRIAVELDAGVVTNSISPRLPSEVRVDALTPEGGFNFHWRASGAIASAKVDAVNLSGLPGRASDLHLDLKAVPPGLDVNVANRDETEVVENELPPPEFCEKEDPPGPDEEPPPPDPECPDHPDYEPPIERITTRTEDLNLSLLTPDGLNGVPGGRLGSGEIQLTSGPDDRLPATAPNGNPLDGVLLHDLEDRFVLFARLSAFDQLELARFKEDMQRRGPGFQRFQLDESLHAVLDTDAEDHALGLDIQKAGTFDTLEKTSGLLASLPAHLELDQSKHESGIVNGRSDALEEITWSATRPVDGWGEGESRKPGFELVNTIQVGDGAERVLSRASLDPMPRTLRVCQLSFGAGCAKEPATGVGIFDHNINRVFTGDADLWDCFPPHLCQGQALPIPIRPNMANKGSVLIEADPATTLIFRNAGTRVGPLELTRFALQAHQDLHDCGDIDPGECKFGFVAMDTGGSALKGELTQGFGSDAETRFVFPTIIPDDEMPWSAEQYVYGFQQTSSLSGHASSAGVVNCPTGTELKAAGDTITNRFCYTRITE